MARHRVKLPRDNAANSSGECSSDKVYNSPASSTIPRTPATPGSAAFVVRRGILDALQLDPLALVGDVYDDGGGAVPGRVRPLHRGRRGETLEQPLPARTAWLGEGEEPELLAARRRARTRATAPAATAYRLARVSRRTARRAPAGRRTPLTSSRGRRQQPRRARRHAGRR